MNDIIKVNYNTDQPTVSARELHEFLEVETPYRIWFPRMCEYGFEENKDFRTFLYETSGGRPKHDAEITIDMAKELCMLQRNERGKQARQYFLQLERDWNSPEKVMARALQIAEKKINSLSERIEQDAPKVLLDTLGQRDGFAHIYSGLRPRKADPPERRGHRRQPPVRMAARARLSGSPQGRYGLQYADPAQHGTWSVRGQRNRYHPCGWSYQRQPYAKGHR